MSIPSYPWVPGVHQGEADTQQDTSSQILPFQDCPDGVLTKEKVFCNVNVVTII